MSTVPTLIVMTTKLEIGGLQAFQREIMANAAGSIPDLKTIVYGTTEKDIKHPEAFPEPTMDQCIYAQTDIKCERPFYLYGKLVNDIFAFDNPTAYMSAKTAFGFAHEKRKAKWSILITYTRASIHTNGESDLLMRTTAGSIEDFNDAVSCPYKLWALIRLSHETSTYHALLKMFRNFVSPLTFQHGLYEMNQQTLLKKSAIESAFHLFLNRPAKELLNVFLSLMYIDGCIENNVLPIAVDEFLGVSSGIDIPNITDTVSAFSKRHANTTHSTPIICNVAKVVGQVDPATINAYHLCKGVCQKHIPIKKSRSGFIFQTCNNAPCISHYAKSANKTIESVLVQPTTRTAATPKVAIPQKGSTKTAASLLYGNAKLPQKPAAGPKTVSALDVQKAKETVTFAAVSANFGHTAEAAAEILRNTPPAAYGDDEESY